MQSGQEISETRFEMDFAVLLLKVLLKKGALNKPTYEKSIEAVSNERKNIKKWRND